MPFDFSFLRRNRGKDWRSTQDEHLEPHLGVIDGPLPPPRMAGPILPRSLPKPSGNRPTGGHMMSPRQMAEWAHEMYVAGAMTWEEYLTAVPADLHPDYDTTVGALTGQPARPDQPRDMLSEWEDKLAFVKRYKDWDADEVRRAERIVTLLRRQANPQAWI